MSIKFSCVTLRHMSFRAGDLPLYLGVSECREQPSVGGVAGFQIALHGVEGLAVQGVRPVRRTPSLRRSTVQPPAAAGRPGAVRV